MMAIKINQSVLARGAENFFNGNVYCGFSAASNFTFAGTSTYTPRFQVGGTSVSTSSISQLRASADSEGPVSFLGKTRGTTATSVNAVQTNDTLGSLVFSGTDGTKHVEAARISVSVASIAIGSVGGQLNFFTTATSATGPSLRMSIQQNGEVVISNTVAGLFTALSLSNLSNNNAAQAILRINGNTGWGNVGVNSSGFTTSGQYGVANEMFVQSGPQASGLYVHASAGSLRFGTASAEHAQIDSSGRFLINTTTPLNFSSAPLQVKAPSATAGCYLSLLPNTATAAAYMSQCPKAGGYDWMHFVGQSGDGTNSNVNAIYIFGNGNVQNLNNAYSGFSDVKLKENIVDATPKLEQLRRVRVVNFNFIGDNLKQLGVVAQELEKIFPGMIDETEDIGSNGEKLGTTTKAVKYSVFVPMLIKAVQELMDRDDERRAKDLQRDALIQELTEQLAALKSK